MASSLIEAQASLVWSWDSPVRSAMAFECFRITGVKDFFQMRLFQMRTTVSSESLTGSSESASASFTIRQPETRLPLGGTPTLSKTAMVS